MSMLTNDFMEEVAKKETRFCPAVIRFGQKDNNIPHYSFFKKTTREI